jgi:hypothetical protein
MITDPATTVPATGAASGCEADVTFFGAPVGPCGQPSAGVYRRICVHEHVKDGRLCQEHADRPEVGLCRTCYDLAGGLSHECPIGIMKVTG